jgi:HD-like signal output (HDOD) protein
MLWTDLKLPDPESVFLSGLIHDIGRLAFLAVGPERYARLMAKARVKRMLLVDAEREEFGGTHAQLGGLLCERWNFPSEVIGPVRHHHTPDEADEATALSTAAVTLGNCLSQKQRVGWTADSSPPEVPGTVIGRLGLKPAHLEGLGSRLEGRRAEIESFTRAFM